MNTFAARPRTPTRPIAVVGMAATFPGAASVDDLWGLLQKGTSPVSQVPPERFDLADLGEHTVDLSTESHKLYGNFLAYPDSFDNSFFHISPREAQAMDPQQRLLLQTAYRALESAGYTPDVTSSWSRETFGTYIGVATHDYEHNLRNSIDVYYSTGTLQSFLSGKIAFVFRFSGPSLVLDTACSSSMVALHQACRALQSGDCNAALAGGVNVITSPEMHVGLSRAHFLSAAGQCRPWDASADGYCRSEGCGLFVLKRLEDALAENDRILGVIRSIEVNQSGNADSITHPHVPTQVALFEKLLAGSGVHPHEISVVECHGTGTQAGDPAELEAIRKVFALGRAVDNPLHITSVKANIGHAEAASGAVSLAKLILMFREKTIPRHPSLVELNPRIPDLGTDNVRIDTVSVPWNCDRPRMALLNNFGASGSNAALLLEEYEAQQRSEDVSLRTGVMVGIACKSAVAVEKLRAAYVAQLEVCHEDPASLCDFAYSATARRQMHLFRISAAGTSKDELIQRLRCAPVTEVRPADKVVFVFSGQGSQYAGMGAELYRELPFVSRIVDDCDRKLTEWGFNTILDGFRVASLTHPPRESPSLQTQQIALFVLEHALAQLWISWGVRPGAVIGHCFGEFVALVVADVLTLDDALKLVATRARLISEKCTSGVSNMASVRASVEQITPLLAGTPGLGICCFNSASHQTIGGPIDQLQVFEQACADRGFHCTRLDIPFAYHSEPMDPVLDSLRESGRGVAFAAPKIPVLSNVAGAMVQPGDRSVYVSDYFARHCRDPARFDPGITHFQSSFDMSTIAAFIEIGPSPSTLSFLRGIQQDGAPLLLPSLRKNTSAFNVLYGTLAQLYRTSVPVKWREVFADLTPEARLIDLPPYPFADARFWVPYKKNGSSGATARVCGPEPGVSPSISTTAAFSLSIPLDDVVDLIQGHRVLGFPLCPASIYADLALAEALRIFRGHAHFSKTDILDLVDVSMPVPLVHVPDRQKKLLVHVDVYPSTHKHSGAFRILSTCVDRDETLCTGSLKQIPMDTRSSKFLCARAVVEREIRRMGDAPSVEVLNTRTVYDLLFPQVVAYGQQYHAINTIAVDSESFTAYAVCHLPQKKAVDVRTPSSAISSIFVDSLFHVAGFLANFTCGMNGQDVFICSQVDRVKVHPGLTDPSARYGVYASAVHMERAVIVVDVFAVAADGSQRDILACLKRVRFRKVAVASFRKLLSLASGRPFGDPECPSEGPSEGAPLPAALQPARLHAKIVRIISETSDIPCADISSDAELTKLGVNSLMIWEVVARLRALLPTSGRAFDVHMFAGATTVGDLVRIVSDQCGRSSEAQTDAPRLVALDSLTTLCEMSEDAGPVHTEEVLDHQVGHSRTRRHDAMRSPTEPAEPYQESIMSIEVYGRFRKSSDSMLGQGEARNDVIYSVWRLQSSNDYPPSDNPQSPTLGRPEMSLSPLARRRSTTPLILIHDGSGLISGYSRLAPLGQDVWAIRNHDFSATHAFLAGGSGDELTILAQGYLHLLATELLGREYGSGCECILGGWSFGGVVAYELARHLLAKGFLVKGLVLIDAPAPQCGGLLPDALISKVIDQIGVPDRTAEQLKAQMKRASRALKNYGRSTLQWGMSVRNPSPPVVYLRSRAGIDISVYDGELDPRERAFLTKEGDERTIPHWETVLGKKIEVLDIPGDHFAVFDEQNVEVVAGQIKEAIRILLSKSSSSA
ncbi:polyketide synthetase [Ganoderma sinense ZZ0214-1]|uniref:Polyketide synthetase n=1 Tax=Ganoderma sinense ZZ0214-1 TaxID=1077348 RepID=A0A2G8S0L9_9APHY|nr:polyketide synthetase [Ganoderma sinense ZZ0214-1]